MAGALRLLACLLALCGCSNYRDPSIKLNSTAVAERTDEAVLLRLSLDLDNPNIDPLELLEFDYDVSIDGRQAYSGRRSAQATLASSSRRQIDIPAVIRIDEMGWDQGPPASARFTIHGTLRYITPGEIAQILFDTGVRRPRAGFRGDGEITF